MIANELEQTIKVDLPPVGVNVMVQCEGFRCLAYRTRDGKWMSTFSQEELQGVLYVFAWNEGPDSCVIPVNVKSRNARSNRVPIRFHG